MVKRVLPDYPQNRDEFELITLKDGDRVVGAVQLSGQLSAESAELVFITSDAQLLRFGADSVRPQGRAAGGMTGVRLSAGASVVWFGAVDADAAAGTPSGPPGTYSPAVVVTVAGSASALPGAAAGSVKVTPLHEFPGKGRATGGVRCHRFLKGEDMLVTAWAGPAPAVGATDSGAPVAAARPGRQAGRLGRRPQRAAGRPRGFGPRGLVAEGAASRSVVTYRSIPQVSTRHGFRSACGRSIWTAPSFLASHRGKGNRACPTRSARPKLPRLQETPAAGNAGEAVGPAWLKTS